MNYVSVALVGLVSGIISGLFGVGGGIVMVPAMIFLLNLDPKVAIGTSLAVIIPTTMMGATAHFHMGHVNWKAALVLAPLAIFGGLVGAKLTGLIHAESLKKAFGGFLVLVGFYMLFFNKPG